jgi:hypothetical protein
VLNNKNQYIINVYLHLNNVGRIIFLFISMQQCGHSKICIKCVDAIYLCPTWFEVFTNARVPLVPLVRTPIEVS